MRFDDIGHRLDAFGDRDKTHAHGAYEYGPKKLRRSRRSHAAHLHRIAYVRERLLRRTTS